MSQNSAAHRINEGTGSTPALAPPTVQRVPKIIGSDIELGNVILGREPEFTRDDGYADRNGGEAARLLLRQIDGISRAAGYSQTGDETTEYYGGHADYGRSRYSAGRRRYEWPQRASDPQDRGRKFLASGSCVYIDMDHLELATAEVRSAVDYVAAARSMLRTARDAMHAVNAQLPAGERVLITANNCDGSGSSWGSHLNFLISRELFSRLFNRMYPDLFVLAAHHASAILFSGQGKVGADNRHPHVDYQISQRADFIEKVTGHETTARRTLVNARDEPHCGGGWGGDYTASANGRYARLHCIPFDNNLCQPANLLKVGTLQLTLAVLEADRGDPAMILKDPVAALHAWSHDPDLTTRAPLADGRLVTAIELQRAFLDRARWFADSVGFEGFVPDAERILDLWEETLALLEARRFDILRRRLDWVLKRWLLTRALAQRPELDWGSPEIKHLDLIYSSLDPDEGLFWSCERTDLVERVVTDAQIERFVHEPPDDTRAWGRAQLLRMASADHVVDVNWDKVVLGLKSHRSVGSEQRTFRLPDPTRATKAELADLFESADSITDLVDRLDSVNRAERERQDHTNRKPWRLR